MLRPTHFFQNPTAGTRHEIAVIQDQKNVNRKSHHDEKRPIQTQKSGKVETKQTGNHQFQNDDRIRNKSCICTQQWRLSELHLEVFKIEHFACCSIDEQEDEKGTHNNWEYFSKGFHGKLF